jgi:soluble lytic murein transglycosylase-like protein
VGLRAAAVAATLVTVVAVGGCTHLSRATTPAAGASSTVAPSRDTATGPAATGSNMDLARYVAPVRKYSAAAGVDAQLLMAILANESYKPHDPNLERAWQKLDQNAAFGIANMHQATFDETKRGRDFADRDWYELPDDPDLAIEAAAWYLHDLAAQLPKSWPARYTEDELLALGYNAGPGSMRTFAQGGKPGAVAQDYLDRLRANWETAGRAVQ